MGRHLFLAVATVALLAPFAAGYPWPVCGTSNTFAANSTYQANLNRVAATLPGNASASPNLYATAVVGAVPEQVRAMALCRGDANATVCGSCLAQAFRDVQNDCPYYKGATIYYDTCTLQYSDVDTLAGDDDTGPITDLSGVTNIGNVTSDPPRFNALLAELLNATADYAAFNSTRRFATGQADFFDKNFAKVYSLAQCPPDQPPARCRKCLAGVIADGLPRFLNSIGGRVLLVSCTYRFETAPFYSGPAMVRLPSPGAGGPAPGPAVATPPAAGEGRKGIAARVSVAIAGFVVLMMILSVFFFLRFGRRIKATKKDHPLKEIGDPQCTVFDLMTLQEATEHFSERNKLGEGGFGTVYKGILSDIEEIAVKTILGRTGHALHQLHNEIQVLAKLQHKNLVRLLGYCLHQNDALLVYEYIKNGSLDSILFDKSTGNALQWQQQYNIILGIAKGILYLHEGSSTRIIHRDLKANNILLDDGMEPKIADFGLARLVGEGHTLTQTARVVGTFGYMAPEYAMHGLVSPKVDIFSFGVLALEIVTRRSNCGSDDYNAVNLLSDVWDHWTKGSISQMLEQSLDGYGRIQALRCIHVGLLCVQVDPDDRPDISAVVFMLTRDDMELQPPEEPAFLFARGSPSASRSDGKSRYVYDRFRSILEQYISVNGLTVTGPCPR